jgi:formylglycine-generating enzyme required for sulfatase activity
VAVAPYTVRLASADRAASPPSAAAEQEEDVTPDEIAPAEPSASAAPEASSREPSASATAPRDGMIHVAGATFVMGSADPKSPANERPRHAETVPSFWIDRTEVTVGAYRACVDAHACAVPPKSSTWCTYDRGDPQLPVNCVYWRDAAAMCLSVGKRLPREAEWELASRGPKGGGRYPWRSPASGCYYAATMVNDTTGRSCTKGPSRVGGHPAGATPSGIQDLAGNVDEWMSDWYVENLSLGAAAAGASHVLRGGGWQSGPSQARSTARNWGSAAEAGPNVGFRCAKNE